MFPKPFFRFISAVTFLLLCSFSVAAADTVMLKDGEKIKGLILDEFKDRIVISTVEGEKAIMKSRIKSAVYNDEEKAILRKAKNQEARSQYVKAYYTYAKALELNPDLEEARKRLDYLKGFLETKTRDDVISKIVSRKERFEDASGTTPLKRVSDELGLDLSSSDKYIFVEDIRNNASEQVRSSVRPGDMIVSVWGGLTAYMDADEVAEMLLSPGEINLTIERKEAPILTSSASFFGGILFSRYKKIIGASLDLKKEGLVVEKVSSGGPFDKAGIKKGDLICRINGNNTRYMPMSEIIDTVKKNQDKKIEVDIRRDITLWRKDKRV